MADDTPDRDLAKLMGAHLLALSKATAVYQAELAKIFLQIEDEDENGQEAAGPAYQFVRDLEKLGLTSSLFDQSPEGTARRMRSWSAGNAALMERWIEMMGQPWGAFLAGARDDDTEE